MARSIQQANRIDDKEVEVLSHWACVTGASSGIGYATAIALAHNGFRVLAHGFRNEEGLQKLQSELQEFGAECRIAKSDLSTEQGRDSLIAEVDQLGSPLQSFAHIAGLDVLTGDTAKKSFTEKLERLWKMDVESTVHLSRAIGSRMKSAAIESGKLGQGLLPPSLVTTGWDQALIGMEGDSGEMFSVIKGAIMSFTQSLSRSLAPAVRVNCVAPGWIKTKWGELTHDYWDKRARSESLLRRWGRPDDIAHQFVFLSSPNAAFISGQVINVNGGFAGRMLD